MNRGFRSILPALPEPSPQPEQPDKNKRAKVLKRRRSQIACERCRRRKAAVGFLLLLRMLLFCCLGAFVTLLQRLSILDFKIKLESETAF